MPDGAEDADRRLTSGCVSDSGSCDDSCLFKSCTSGCLWSFCGRGVVRFCASSSSPVESVGLERLVVEVAGLSMLFAKRRCVSYRCQGGTVVKVEGEQPWCIHPHRYDGPAVLQPHRTVESERRGPRFLSPCAAKPTDLLYAIDILYARSGLDGEPVGPLYRGAATSLTRALNSKSLAPPSSRSPRKPRNLPHFPA